MPPRFFLSLLFTALCVFAAIPAQATEALQCSIVLLHGKLGSTKHPNSRYVVVKAGHGNAPDVAAAAVLDWVQALP